MVGEDPAPVRTGVDGTATLEVEDCNGDPTLRIDGQLALLWTPKQVVCEGSPLIVVLTPTQTPNPVIAVLENPDLPPLDLPPDLAGEQSVLTAALFGDDFATATEAANNLAFVLKDTQPALAQSFSSIAIDSGFRALGLDPANPDLPLIAFDPGQDLTVMTPAGSLALQKFQVARRISVREGMAGQWTGATVREVARIDSGSATRSLTLVTPGNVQELYDLQIGPSGRFGT